MHDGDQSIEPPRRSWLPHPAWLTLATIVAAILFAALWCYWPYLRSSNLAREIEAHGGYVETLPAAPGWLREYVAAELLPKLPLIHTVELRGQLATDHLIGRLSRERELRNLIVQGNDISDGGIETLQQASALEALLLIDCPNVTAAALNRLRQQLPRLKVLQRGPAFLGVECFDTASGCEVRFVRPGSPAANAGLLAGDTITHFANKPVTTFDSLVSLIAVRKPGDEVPIRYQRHGTELETRATVEAWK